MFDPYVREACLLVSLISGIPLAVSAACGLLVAIIQTSTQIQEQSITYVVKLCAVSICFFVLWRWASAELVRFLQQALDSLSSVARG